MRDWLKGLPEADRRILGHDIGLAEFGWPVGMPLCRSLGGGLWEVRSNLTHGRIARVIFCVAHGRMVLLHGSVKKTKKRQPRIWNWRGEGKRRSNNDKQTPGLFLR